MRCRWLFINANPQVLPIHTNSTHTVAPYAVRTVNGCNFPWGTGWRRREHRRRKCREDSSCASEGKGMTPNVRPDREIQHTSDAQPRYPLSSLYSASDISECCLHFRALSFPNFRDNYQKDFDFQIYYTRAHTRN